MDDLVARTPPGPRSTVLGLLACASLVLGSATAAVADKPHQSSGSYAHSGPAEGRPPNPSILPSFAGDTLERLAAKATDAVVLLDVETGDGSRQGSGFIVDPGGMIITNHHVIEGARRIQVKLASGDVFERVSIMGIDERRDIAVLEIPGYGLPTIPLGNSDSVRVGSPVIVIGSPLGLENTVSTGIVSARRDEPDGYQLLQMSAPASQGSSGGAVIAQSGRVVGISVSQMTDGQNLNFAVPINYARGLLDHIDGEPVATLSPESGGSGSELAATSSEAGGVNAGLEFDLGAFRGYTFEMDGTVGEDRRRRTRVTYRRIEAVGGRPSIERYEESETAEKTGPFGSTQTIRKERSRAIVAAESLQPISVHGEVATWNGTSWREREYTLRFEGNRVTGTVEDGSGAVREVERELPPGTILRSTRHLAFATLQADSLLDRSVELVTFDAESAEMTTDRYDVRDSTRIQVDGREFRVLRVNLASGLTNSTLFFRQSVPRVLLRRDRDHSGAAEEVTRLRLFGSDRDATESREDATGADGG